MSTKIHTLVDALGNPIGFHLTGGEAHDLVGADELLPEMEADMLLADKAFDADERVIKPLAAAGKTAVIPSKANRKQPRNFDRHMYAARPRTSSPNSSNIARSLHVMIRPHANSSPPSILLPASSGSIDDTP